jgi:hypothetical protein
MSRIAIVALSGILFAAVPAAGQALPSGTWGGTIEPPGAQPMPVEYEVSSDGGEMSITLVWEMGSFDFENIKLDGSSLTFTWFLGMGGDGVDLTCDLQRQDDGGFEGECVDDTGEAGVLTMTPPGTRQ